MVVRELRDCEEFIAGDNCRLREILHPDKADLKFRYSLAHAVVKPGDTTWQHRLRMSEVYYIIEGEGIMHIEDETRPVRLDSLYPAECKTVHPKYGKARPNFSLHR